MTRLAAAGVCAVAAGLLLTACGGESAKPLTIDENAGRVGRITLGDTRATVIVRLGKPGEVNSRGPFTPLGEYYEEIGGPPSIPTPEPGEVLRYDHFAALLIGGRVYSMIVSGKAHTAAGPGIGDSLATVEKVFPRGYCGSVGTEDSGDIPFCSFPVRAGRIAFGKDPVRSITLTAHPSR